MSKVRTQIMMDLDVFITLNEMQKEMGLNNISQVLNKYVKKSLSELNEIKEEKNVWIWRLEQKEEKIKNLQYEIRQLKEKKAPTPPKKEKIIKEVG